MNEHGSPLLEATSVPTGRTPPSVREEALGHGGSTAEASPRVLTTSANGAPTTPVSSDTVGTGAAPSGGDSFKIVRSTTRILLDLRPLGDEEAKKLRAQLWQTHKDCATAANAVLRSYWRDDGMELDKLLERQGHGPHKGADWPMARYKSKGYWIARAVAPELVSNIAATVSNMVTDKWRRERWDALVYQKSSPPHWRTTLPIPIGSQKYRVAEGPHGLAISFTLRAGDDAKRWHMPVELRDDHQREILGKLLSGQWKRGEMRLQEDPRRPGRWFMRLSYKRKVLKRVGGTSAAVNRGIRNFLVAVGEDGERWVYEGLDIVAYLKQIQRRRREYQRSALASGRSGRGRKHILHPTAPLMAKGERWRHTKCQVVARRLAKWLDEHGVSRLFVEDFSGIRNGEPERLKGGKRIWNLVQEWPYYELQTRLESCCNEYGIEVVMVPPEYISQTCPVCGNVDESLRDLGRWMLRCPCGHKEGLDAAAARNVLARGMAGAVAEPKKTKRVRAKKGSGKAGARKPSAKDAKRKGGADKGSKG